MIRRLVMFVLLCSACLASDAGDDHASRYSVFPCCSRRSTAEAFHEALYQMSDTQSTLWSGLKCLEDLYRFSVCSHVFHETSNMNALPGMLTPPLRTTLALIGYEDATLRAMLLSLELLTVASLWVAQDPLLLIPAGISLLRATDTIFGGKPDEEGDDDES